MSGRLLERMALAMGVQVPAVCHSSGEANTRPRLVGHDLLAGVLVECFVTDGGARGRKREPRTCPWCTLGH